MHSHSVFPNMHVECSVFNWKESIWWAPFSVVSKAKGRKYERIVEWEIWVNQKDNICNMENCSVPEYMGKNAIITLLNTFLRSLKKQRSSHSTRITCMLLRLPTHMASRFRGFCKGTLNLMFLWTSGEENSGLN